MHRWIISVDPGPTNHGWAILDRPDGVLLPRIALTGHGPWAALERDIATVACCDEAFGNDTTSLVVEKMRNYGRVMGNDAIMTSFEAGRVVASVTCSYPHCKVYLVSHPDWKLCLTGRAQAKDTEIRGALLELFPGTGGGACPQIGTQKEPGPLFLMKGEHVRDAVALGVAFMRFKDERGIDPEDFRYGR